ncbi:purine and uridine phosphorylase [Polychaeton citri CBS 116435]|uniref:Purine and uridine phosphorylase n=1 Tax=Polychaeton citri CBS 116435 TaxID=1314669 RepID=A0A9P4Q6U8_9PEZI|nr:purine and uridine phosphorylase [Polychaeton citri CBS 116435]
MGLFSTSSKTANGKPPAQVGSHAPQRRATPATRYNVASYAIGWIAALEHELIAALSMLDESHQCPTDYRQYMHDPNTYNWGRIGQQNVVIVSLMRPYGKASAAIVTKNLAMTHPDIRLAFLVGIGAGVPRPGHDVRLGDVVVSHARGNGSVIAYDLIKTLKSGIELSVSPYASHKTLQKAVISLAARHKSKGSRMTSIIGEAFKRYPRLANSTSWRYQGAKYDVLCKDTYMRLGPRHQRSFKTNPSDVNGVLVRKPRASSSPVIHYGTIGSGDVLIKALGERERILDRLPEDCICLEMEAAGVMPVFPALVVRGICDYADTQKNDMWQNYAAITAAAYTRELLENL